MKNIPNAISLPVSEVGLRLCGLPDGPMTSKSGPDHVPASLFPSPENDEGQTTNGISGPSLPGSSESANLQSSLANRLKERFGKDGSMEYAETWREKVTPSGRTYWAHTASARRTSDSDCIGWPTPRAEERNQHNSQDAGMALSRASNLAGWPTPQAGTPATENYNEAGNTDSGRKTVKLAGWRSPNKSDGEGGMLEMMRGTHAKFKLRDQSMLSGCPTASTRDHKGGYAGGRIRNGKTSTDTLDVTAQLAGWITPNTDDRPGKNQGRNLGQQVTVSATTGTGPSAGTNAGTRNSGAYRLNPLFSLWLMGYNPAAWASCGARAMQSCRNSRRNSSKRPSKR